MNQKRNIEKKAKSHNRQGIQDASVCIRLQPNQINLNITKAIRSFNIFLIQNIGKGPPGRVRSPGARQALFPDHPPNAQTGNGTIYSNEYQYFINKQKTNYLSQLNFTIMKKQIFILVFLVVATFASVNNSYGQTSVHGSVPIALSCTDDPLHPIAGKAYTYDLVTPGAGTYTYWATKDPVFYAPDSTYTTNLGARLDVVAGQLTAVTNYGAPLATATTTITWTTEILAGTSYKGLVVGKTPTFVAVNYAETSGCADNFKVFELDPKNGFTVDILALNPVTKAPDASLYTYVPTQCFPIVTAATYTAGAMDYLYGNSTLYYEVVASNFSASWTPSFRLTGLLSTQVAAIEWDYTTAFTAPVKVTSGTADGVYASPSAAATSVTDTSNGVSIYVRLTVRNNSFEGLADQPIALAVDGENASGQLDVVNTTCLDPGATPDFVDTVNQTLNKRPTVTAGPLTAASAAPNNVIVPKNP